MKPTMPGGNDHPSRKLPAAFKPMLPVPATYATRDTGRPVGYFRFLGNHKGTLALLALAGGLLGGLIVWRQPYVYRARSYVEVLGVNEDLLNKRELDPNAKHDDFSQSYVNTVARLLQSGQLDGKVAAGLNKGPEKWNPPVTEKEIGRGVRIVTHDSDRVLEVTAESTDPKRAAAIANGLIATFIQQDLESRWLASNSTSQWLRKELEDLATKLRSSEDELEAFTRRSNLLIEGDEGDVSGSFVRNVQDEYARAQADRMNKESLYEHLKQNAGAPAVLPTDSISEQYELQLGVLKKQLAELESTYTPDYYKIPPVKAQIAQVEKALAAQRKTQAARLENEYRTASRREQLLRAQYASQLRHATDQTAKMVQYAALKSQVEMNRAVYAEMMQKVKGYGVASAMQASNVRVVDPAQPPTVPTRPNKPLTAALSSFAFFCVGALWLMVRAGSNRNITEPGESQQFLQVPELGVIPAASASARQAVDSVPLRRAGGFRGFRKLTRHNGHGRLETVTWHSSSCLLAESFRSASASLLLPRHGRDRKRVLVVTSLSPSEGKTTVASNMAIAMAGVSGRVLLIDADRRRARLHTVFGCANDKGIAELLQPGAEAELDVDECIAETGIPNLWVLPTGKANLPTPDLYYSARMSELLAQLRDEFDLVLIDTPPLLYLSDARVLGRMSDGVILVIRAGQVPWENAVSASQRLADDGVPVVGTVLNDWNPRTKAYGAYSYDKHVKSYLAS